jgi:hypothetical protein
MFGRTITLFDERNGNGWNTEHVRPFKILPPFQNIRCKPKTSYILKTEGVVEIEICLVGRALIISWAARARCPR